MSNDTKFVNCGDLVILSAELECVCGRTKERAHCPKCGRVKLYASSETVMKVASFTGDVVKDCVLYRCMGCGHKFSDLDWYFHCRAPKKIDFGAMKQKKQDQLKEYWLDRIRTERTFDYNTRAKCRAEAGFDPVDMQKLFQEAKKLINRPHKELTVEEQISFCKEEIDNVEYWIKMHPGEDHESAKDQIARAKVKIYALKHPNAESEASLKNKLESHMVNCNLCNILPDGQYCPEGQRIKNES